MGGVLQQESDHSASIRRIIVPMDADVSETTERMIVSFQAQLKNFPDLLREFNNSLRDGKIFFVEPKRTN